MDFRVEPIRDRNETKEKAKEKAREDVGRRKVKEKGIDVRTRPGDGSRRLRTAVLNIDRNDRP